MLSLAQNYSCDHLQSLKEDRVNTKSKGEEGIVPALLKIDKSKEKILSRDCSLQGTEPNGGEVKEESHRKEIESSPSEAPQPKPSIPVKASQSAPPPRPFPPDLLNSLAAELAEGRKSGMTEKSAQRLVKEATGNGMPREKEKNLIDMLLFMSKKEDDTKAESKLESETRGKDLERRDSEGSEHKSEKSFTDKMSSGFSSMFAGASFGSFGKKDEKSHRSVFCSRYIADTCF